jgi:hypothetical protein
LKIAEQLRSVGIMNKFTVVLLAGALVSASCSENKTPPTAPTTVTPPAAAAASVRVTGRIVDYQSGLGMSGSLRLPSKVTETTLLVNPGTCAARYGYVYDAVTRTPIAGVRVTRAGTATTGADGYYRIDIGCVQRDGLYWGIGTTTISASHPAYQGAFELDGRREATSYSGIRRVDFALQPL